MKWWQYQQGNFTTKTKVVIIGAGAGGAFSACTLAEAGIDVVVLEKGHHYSISPKNLADAVSNLYEEGGFRTADGKPPTPIAGGTGLGGSTLVNSAICFKTPAKTLAQWNELSEGVFQDESRFYQVQNEVEEVMKVAPTPEFLLSGNDKAHKAAALKLGWAEGNIRRNTPGCAGCGRCNLGCPTGGKNTVDRELLPRAQKAGAQIIAGAEVTKITTKQVSGFLHDESNTIVGEFTINADYIIMAGGSIATPQLLLESGFGEQNEHIGVGLHVHPVISTWGVLSEDVYTRGATQGHYVDEFADDHVLLESNPIILGAFFQSFPVYGMAVKELMMKGRQMVSTGALVKDVAQGRVHKRNKGAAKISYSISEIDRRRLLKGLHAGAEIWLNGANAEMVSFSVFGSKICRSMDEVRNFLHSDFPANRLTPYSSHPQASCRIGKACAPTGRLKTTDNIYVMDASVLPSNVGRNPQISVMTVSRILSVQLAEKLGGTVAPLNS